MWRSLGKVVPGAGVFVRSTANESDPLARYSAHAMLFQQIPGNTGKIYIADRETANITTGVGVLATLAIPSANTLPSASATVTYAPAAFNLNDYWIGAEVNGEGCLVSAVRA
jgi:hypothetical protein